MTSGWDLNPNKISHQLEFPGRLNHRPQAAPNRVNHKCHLALINHHPHKTVLSLRQSAVTIAELARHNDIIKSKPTGKYKQHSITPNYKWPCLTRCSALLTGNLQGRPKQTCECVVGSQLEFMSSWCLKFPSNVSMTSAKRKAQTAEPAMLLTGVVNTAYSTSSL